MAQALANQANAKPRSAAWAAGVVEGVYTDLETQVHAWLLRDPPFRNPSVILYCVLLQMWASVLACRPRLPCDPALFGRKHHSVGLRSQSQVIWLQPQPER